MSRHTDARIVPFMTPWTCTDPSCNGRCGRSHEIPPAIPRGYENEGGDAA